MSSLLARSSPMPSAIVLTRRAALTWSWISSLLSSSLSSPKASTPAIMDARPAHYWLLLALPPHRPPSVRVLLCTRSRHVLFSSAGLAEGRRRQPTAGKTRARNQWKFQYTARFARPTLSCMPPAGPRARFGVRPARSPRSVATGDGAVSGHESEATRGGGRAAAHQRRAWRVAVAQRPGWSRLSLAGVSP